MRPARAVKQLAVALLLLSLLALAACTSQYAKARPVPRRAQLCARFA